MPEHLIRLRGGWELTNPNSPGSTPERVDLPVRDLDRFPNRFTLSRRFGKPRLGADDDPPRLRLAQIAGIHRMILNGTPLAIEADDEGTIELELPELQARNHLVIEVARPSGPVGRLNPNEEEPWGEVAIVIRTAGEGGGREP